MKRKELDEVPSGKNLLLDTDDEMFLNSIAIALSSRPCDHHVNGNSLHYLRLNSLTSDDPDVHRQIPHRPIQTLPHLKLSQTPLGERTQTTRVSV